MSEESVGPALTPEEWKALAQGESWADETCDCVAGYYQGFDGSKLTLGCGNGYDFESADPSPSARHALAALCLYQQPFGFSRDELRSLNMALNEMGADDTEWYDDVRVVASKIRALLPPEDAK